MVCIGSIVESTQAYLKLTEEAGEREAGEREAGEQGAGGQGETFFPAPRTVPQLLFSFPLSPTSS